MIASCTCFGLRHSPLSYYKWRDFGHESNLSTVKRRAKCHSTVAGSFLFQHPLFFIAIAFFCDHETKCGNDNMRKWVNTIISYVPMKNYLLLTQRKAWKNSWKSLLVDYIRLYLLYLLFLAKLMYGYYKLASRIKI